MVHVQFPCTTVSAAPASIRAVVVGGHGGYARVVGVSASTPDTFRVRVMRVSLAGPNLDPPGPVEFFRRDATASVVGTLFDRMRTALAARVTTEWRPPSSLDRIELEPYGVSSASWSLELTLQDTGGAASTRAWPGRLGTLGAEDRAPTELAWRFLSEVTLEGTASRDPEAEDRELLTVAWSQSTAGFERPWYVTPALLRFAARAGSEGVLPRVVEQLDSKEPEVRSLAVDAIASITEYDTRRGPDGNLRPLDDVVAEYRRECSAP